MPTFWRVFIINWYWIMPKAFTASTEMIVSFLLFNLLMWCITFVDQWILKTPCIPGMNPTWSCCCCSVTKMDLTLCSLMDCSTPGCSVFHSLLELWCYLTISSFSFSLSQHQDLFQWASSLHQVAKLLELQLQRQSFQWMFGIDFL